MVEEHDAKKIITIEVIKSPIKLVFALDKAFKIVGKTNQRLTSGEIRELARYGALYCYSAQIVKGATIDDISSGGVSKFVEQAKERRGWTIEVHGTNEFLTKIGSRQSGKCDDRCHITVRKRSGEIYRAIRG